MDANGSANGNSYCRRARDARARVTALRLEAEARLLESWGVEPQPGYPTSWYDPFDAGRHWGLPPAWLWHGGGRDARQDGADRPFVWHEVDLDRSRGLARWLAAKNLWAVGTLNTLTNYAVKTGFKWEAVPAAGMEQDRTALVLARLAQRVIDEFSDLNTLPFWEREAFSTSRRDGECFYRFFAQDGGTTLLRPVLPEQVRQPLGSPASCTFGIETDPRDVLRPIYYYVDYEAGAPDGYARDDYEDVPAGEVAHLKLNVDAVVKRGLSDFYCCHESFDQLSKLLRNMATTAANQSAISWYEKYPNVSQDKLWELGARRRDLNRPGWTDPFSGRQPNFEKITPGEIRFLNGNAEIIPAPLAQNTNQHISILQACLRALGRRWDMPEYMASGDASNANYASTLVAGSPFVNAVECEQARYLVHFRRWQMAALRNAAAAGRFRLGGRAWAFEDVMRLVAVHGTPPAVAVANRQAEAMQDLQDLAAGVTSLQVVRGKRGLDSAKVEQDLREQPPTRVVGRATDVDAAGNPVGPGGGVREAVLREGFTGTITDSLGRTVHYRDGKRVKVEGGPGAGHEEATAAMRAAHPFPRGAMPASPPGSGRADLIAQDPALRQAEARRAGWVRQHHRAFVASAVDALLHGPPPAPLPPPDPAAPVARKAALAGKAVRRLDDAAGTETMLGPAFESHAREAAAAHPGGPAALAAAREEASRRTADAARQLAGHLEGLADALPDPAHRPLARADLSRGHLIDAPAVHPELRPAVEALAARLPHAEHAPSGLRLAVGDTPGAKAALVVLRDLGAARRPGEDEDTKEEVLRRLGGKLPPDLRGKG